MTADASFVTAEQLVAMPEPWDGSRMELFRGEIVYSPLNGAAHGQATRRIGGRLGDFVDPRRLGAVGVGAGFHIERDPDTVLAPDAHFTAQQSVREPGFIERAPTLAVEVVSPNDRDTDVQRKVEAYLAAGSDRVWLARPEQETVTVYRSDGTARITHNGDVLTSDDAAFGVDGFELAVADIFAE